MGREVQRAGVRVGRLCVSACARCERSGAVMAREDVNDAASTVSDKTASDARGSSSPPMHQVSSGGPVRSTPASHPKTNRNPEHVLNFVFGQQGQNEKIVLVGIRATGGGTGGGHQGTVPPLNKKF